MIKIKKGNLTTPKLQVEEQRLPSDEPLSQPAPEVKAAKVFGKFLNFRRSPVIPEMPVQLKEIMPKEDDQPKIGWQSPAYSISRPVDMNPVTLSETRCIAYSVSDSVEVRRLPNTPHQDAPSLLGPWRECGDDNKRCARRRQDAHRYQPGNHFS